MHLAEFEARFTGGGAMSDYPAAMMKCPCCDKLTTMREHVYGRELVFLTHVAKGGVGWCPASSRTIKDAQVKTKETA